MFSFDFQITANAGALKSEVEAEINDLSNTLLGDSKKFIEKLDNCMIYT